MLIMEQTTVNPFQYTEDNLLFLNKYYTQIHKGKYYLLTYAAYESTNN